MPLVFVIINNFLQTWSTPTYVVYGVLYVQAWFDPTCRVVIGHWWDWELDDLIKGDKFWTITLFISIIVFHGTSNILHNIPHIQYECKECFVKLCQSHKTLTWIFNYIIFFISVLYICNKWLTCNEIVHIFLRRILRHEKTLI